MKNNENNDQLNIAKDFNKNKNFAKAIEIYEKLFEEKRNANISLEYIFCLLQNKNYDKALEISRIAYKEYSDNIRIKFMYAQAVYYTQIKTTKPDTKNFIKAATAVTKLVSPEQKYSPYQNTILRTLDFLKKNYPQNPNTILEWANKLNIDDLDTRPFVFENKNSDKKIKIASQLEKWALHKANALKDLKKYDELLSFLEQILENPTIKKSTYNIWFLRIKAIALLNTSNINPAQDLYSQIIQRKNDWFLIYEFAEILIKNNKQEIAIQKILEINIIYTPYFAAIKILGLIEKILKENKQTDFSLLIKLHISKIKLQTADKPEKNLIKDFYSDTKKLQALLAETKKIYTPQKPETQGIILKILEGNKSGFIKYGKNDTIYFETKEYKGPIYELTAGQKVRFKTAESFDKKKRQKSLKAVDIYKINI